MLLKALLGVFVKSYTYDNLLTLKREKLTESNPLCTTLVSKISQYLCTNHDIINPVGPQKGKTITMFHRCMHKETQQNYSKFNVNATL